MSARLLFLIVVVLSLCDSIVGSMAFRFTGSVALANVILFAKYVVFLIGFLRYIYHVTLGAQLFRHELAGLGYLLVMAGMMLTLSVFYPEHAADNRFYSYVFPVIIYFFGVNLRQSSTLAWQATLRTYISFYLVVTVLVGLPVYLLGAEWFWRDVIDYGSYVREIKGFDDVVGDLPGNFFYDPYFLRVLRFVGSLGDPLAVGYSSMILGIASWYAFPRWRYLFACIFIGIILAALTRAALLGMVVSMMAFWFLRERSFWMLFGACFVGLFAILVFGDTLASLLGDSSTEGHVLSVGQMVDFMDPLTLAGGTLLGGKEGLFEPGLLNILFSFGVVPFGLLVWFISGIFAQHASDEGPTKFVSVVFLAGTITLAIFSPSFFAVTSSWFAWFIAGFTSRRAPVVVGVSTAPRALPAPVRAGGPGASA